MKLRRMLLALLLCLALLLPLGAAASADPAPFYLRVLIGERRATVQALQNEYAGNYYLSLSDLSAVLRGTRCAFRFAYKNTAADGEYFTVSTGQYASNDSAAGNATERPWTSVFDVYRNRLFIDGEERRYYTYRAGKDLFMSLTDIQLMLGLTAELQEEGLRLYPDQHFYPDVPMLAEAGSFDGFNAVLLGDADTGEILYESCAGEPVAVASVSKLMTYLLVAEAARDGAISLNDKVTISEKAAALSEGADAMVQLKEGSSVPARELLTAMLLASSNECALALAEHTAGTEAAFVELMNQRAQELGMETARFYNPHGLPIYLPQALSAKVQNRMSGEDLFLLCRTILSEFPEITRITRERFAQMTTLKYTTANSNALVFNLPGCTGLKTGSTNKAGSCLAATLPVTVNGETHTIVAIVLGAETPASRNQAAELLLRYAECMLKERGFAVPTEEEPVIPETEESEG